MTLQEKVSKLKRLRAAAVAILWIMLFVLIAGLAFFLYGGGAFHSFTKTAPVQDLPFFVGGIVLMVIGGVGMLLIIMIDGYLSKQQPKRQLVQMDPPGTHFIPQNYT